MSLNNEEVLIRSLLSGLLVGKGSKKPLILLIIEKRNPLAEAIKSTIFHLKDAVVMKKITFLSSLSKTLLVSFSLLLIFSACSVNPRKELQKMNIDYSNQAFVDSAAGGNEKAVKLFLEAGMNANAKNGFQETILIAAARQGHQSIVDLAIQSGVGLDHQDAEGLSAIHWAGRSGWPEIAETLIKAGVFVDVPDRDYKTTPLMYAAIQGHYATAEKLLALGANVNMRNKDGGTPLMNAAFAADANIIRLFLQQGANVNARVNNGYSALMFAAMSGGSEAVDVLLQHGADKTARNAEGQRAKDIAESNGYMSLGERL